MQSFRSQADFFLTDSETLSIDECFATAKRIPLDMGSWVEVIPGWISGSRRLIEHLTATAEWSQRDRRLFEQTVQEPRLTAEYRCLSDVSDAALLTAAAALTTRYGLPFDALWLNLYRDGQDSTGWHRDRFSVRRTTSIVPVLTLGATRRFLLKPRAGGTSRVFKPSSGDLIVMGGRCQEDWLHSVPKDPTVTEPRISINFQSTMQSGRAARGSIDTGQ